MSRYLYTGTRAAMKTYSAWLQFNGIKAIHYNAGLDAAALQEIEEGLQQNRWKCVVSQNSNIVNGIAGSYYGVSNVGAIIYRCKYENGGDFPDYLIKLALRAFRKKYGNEQFDLILYVPPQNRVIWSKILP